jgi:CRISPR-associated exonuclease Cas4
MNSQLSDDEYLLISGIQHFAFCQRQWALICVEGAWTENYLTATGRILHDKADNPWFNEIRKDMIISRSMPLISKELGLQGVADIVELTKNDAGVPVSGRKGRWILHPVEYKRGRPKSDNCDAMQLCAQAMCLEEMLNTSVADGEIFYGQIRRREHVDFTPALRSEVKSVASKMHQYFTEGIVPLGKEEKKCKACSLFDDCNPRLLARRGKVQSYISREIADTESVIGDL